VQPRNTSAFADAGARLLDDDGPQGRNKMSYHFHSARSYPDRNGPKRASAQRDGEALE
jgi:hypothetical protein